MANLRPGGFIWLAGGQCASLGGVHEELLDFLLDLQRISLCPTQETPMGRCMHSTATPVHMGKNRRDDTYAQSLCP